MSFITLIIVISILVFVHEFGHFIVAKISKVRVDEFSIGFPPRLWSFRVGETLYSLNLILFGGYVKIFGENPDADSIDGPDSKRSFVNKNRGIQAAILIAGIAMNILFAWALLSASFMIGVREAASSPESATSVLIGSVLPGSPAEKAGLLQSDLVTSVTNAKGEKSSKVNSEIIQAAIGDSKGEPVTLTYSRGSDERTASIIATDGVVAGKPAIGISMVDVADVHYGFFKAIYEGGKSTIDMTVATAVGLFGFFKSLFIFHADLSQVSGPVGIAGYLEQARAFGAATLFSFIAIISINLAIVNLLPFPALDGGRLLFVAIEAVIRRPLSPKIANTLNLLGFGILLLLMVVITFSDIGKLIW